MEGHGRSWKVMEGHGRSWKVVEGQERSRKVMEGHERSWMVFSHHWIDISGENYSVSPNPSPFPLDFGL